jgi:hypothetical protein
MQHTSRWIAAFFLFTLSGVNAALAQDVPIYGRFEAEFNHSSQSSNPYRQLSATMTLTQPDGHTVTVPLFWDGGSTWRARFSPWLTGTWRYTTSSADKGLDNKSGSFECVTSTNKGSLVQMPNAAYHFAYQDGTPVWWLGDTNWYQFSTIPSEQLNTESANAYIDARASQGFNVIHGTLYTARGDETVRSFVDVKDQEINLAYWQEVDKRLAYINDKQIVAGLVLAWGFGQGSWLDFPSQEARLRFARYVAARYSAYNVYFLAAAEWGFWPWGKENGQAVFGEIAQTVAANDPHHRMIGVHADTTATQAEVFADDSWSSFGDYQQYYGGAPSIALATDAQRNDMALRLLHSRDHGKPVINAEYAYFMRDKNGDGTVDKENSRHRDDFRKASWVLAMNGGYFVTGFGSTYRGGLSSAGLFDPTDPVNDIAIADLQVLSGFFRSQEWWTLNPRSDLVTGSGYHYGLASIGQRYIVYSTSTASVNLSLGDGAAAEATYKVLRFDPRTGDYAALPDHTGAGSIQLSAPDGQDWVFVVQKR